MKDILYRIRRDLLLIRQNPKNYLYSFLFTPNKRVTLHAYDPKSSLVARNIMKKIEQKIKKVKVEFVGSAALKLPGEKDIDLFIPTTKKQLRGIEKGLIELYGQPVKQRHSFSEWKFRQNGFQVELMLIDKTSKAYIEQKMAYEVLKKYKKVRDAYRTLKISSRGISRREYQRRRMAFYNHIIRAY